MDNGSKDSPLKRSRRSQQQKSPFTSSFRTKTQKAIQMINKHEQYKYNFLKTLSNSKKFINTSRLKRDEQYYNIIQIPQLLIEQTIKVQLLPYSDQIYKIQNPFYIVVNKHNKQQQRNKSLDIQQQQDDQLSSQGTVPIHNSQSKLINNNKYQFNQLKINKSLLQHKDNNYDCQTNCKLKIYIKNYRGSPIQLFIYFQNNSTIKDFNLHFHKFIINTEKIINININDFIDKQYIYLKLKSKTQLSMFTMRVDQQTIVKKKIITEITEINQSWNNNQINKKLPQLKGNRSLKSFKNIDKNKNTSNSLKKSGSLILGSMDKIPSNNQMSPSSKKKNKQILQQLKKQQLQKKREQQQKKHQQILQKKFDIQLAKQKQLKLKSKALQMKKLVQQYKLIYQDQKQYIKYLQPNIAVLFIIPRFHKVCHQMIMERQKGMKMAWKTRMLTKKFMKIIKNKYKDSIQHIRSRKTRQLTGILNFTTLFAKILNKNAIQKSHNVIMSTIKHCNPGLIINHSFDYATTYRRSIRTIQRTWLIQYKARMEMFQIYVKDQAQSLIIKYPYFKYIQAKFHTDNVPKTLAYKYLADESSKLKYLFQDYQQKMKQIDDFKEMNKKIAQFNKTALKKRQKPYLDVPKEPCFPSLRYFRNISFLKSMIRGWFELEYRKWSKANKSYLQSVQADKKKPVSPKKSIISKPSINSVELSQPRKDTN